MKILTHEDIKRINIDPLESLTWVETVLKEKKNLVLPPKISLSMENNAFFNTMPSLLFSLGNIGGVKIVDRFPQRTPSLNSQILLYDLNTGNCVAMLDGNYITALRTGTVAAQSIKKLSSKNAKNIGFIGLGNQARATYKILNAIWGKKKIKIRLQKYKEQHESFTEYIKSLENFEFRELSYFDDPKDLISDSDVIISAVTYMQDDFCDSKHYKKGCTVVPIHTRGFLNCDLVFDKVFADDIGHVQKFKNFEKFKPKLNEVADVINGSCPGRENSEERIIVYNIGLSIHDIYFAKKIYEKSKNIGLGFETTLNSLNEKIWFV